MESNAHKLAARFRKVATNPGDKVKARSRRTAWVAELKQKFGGHLPSVDVMEAMALARKFKALEKGRRPSPEYDVEGMLSHMDSPVIVYLIHFHGKGVETSTERSKHKHHMKHHLGVVDKEFNYRLRQAEKQGVEWLVVGIWRATNTAEAASIMNRLRDRSNKHASKCPLCLVEGLNAPKIEIEYRCKCCGTITPPTLIRDGVEVKPGLARLPKSHRAKWEAKPKWKFRTQ